MRHLLVALACAGLAACSSGGSGGTTGPGNTPAPTLTWTGDFHPVAHTVTGMADVYMTGSASEVRFTSTFATQANPNLEVWLVGADDVTDNMTVLQSAHVSLGPLQSATGAQAYPVPGGVDISQYRSVVVWCVSAQVNFATAPLMMR